MSQLLLSEWLRSAIEKKNMSVRYAAVDMGLTQPTISRLLNGRVRPDVKTIMAIAKYFDADFDGLLTMAGYRHGDTANKLDDPQIDHDLKLVVSGHLFPDQIDVLSVVLREMIDEAKKRKTNSQEQA